MTGQPSGYAGKGGGTSSYASSCKRDTKIMTTITRVITETMAATMKKAGVMLPIRLARASISAPPRAWPM